MDATNNGQPTIKLNGQRVESTSPEAVPTPPPEGRPPVTSAFDRPVILQQSSFWSRAILWTLMGVATTAVIWACTAQIEEAIPAQGKLEPQGTVKDVQVPVNGVVKTVHVKDGQHVAQGDLLLSLDPATAQAQMTALKQVRTALVQENQFYEAQLKGRTDALTAAPIPPQVLTLTKSRAALLAENQLFRAQMDGTNSGIALSAGQVERLQSNQAELATRMTTARLETGQLEQQLGQAQTKLATAQQTLAVNQKILANILPLAQSGAISQIQFLKQQQDVAANQSEIDQLTQELTRLQLAIAASQTKVESTVAVDHKDLTARMANNEQRIAEIDGQLAKVMLENNKKIAETNGQIAQAEQTLKYGELRAPTAGTVFELKANTPGFVTNSAEPVLKIVPDDSLIAKVSITNQDIGFVKEGMPVDVRIDSFPFSEFGDVKGTLIWVGSDALPPTQIQPYYTFPAKIKLGRQALLVNGREIRLQSGMALTGNIKVRQRTVMSIFLDQFMKSSESLKFVR